MRWFSLRIGGQRWTAHLVSPRSKLLLGEDGSHLFGSCEYARCRINVSRGLADEARDDTLLHEILHATLFVSGADKALGGSDEAEEQLVSGLTSTLHRVLIDLGFRFPKGK